MSSIEALSWLKTLGFSIVVLEMDALNVFNALVKSSRDFSYADSIINDCKIFAHDLVECPFSFVKRSTNRVAHTLVRTVSSTSNLGE